MRALSVALWPVSDSERVGWLEHLRSPSRHLVRWRWISQRAQGGSSLAPRAAPSAPRRLAADCDDALDHGARNHQDDDGDHELHLERSRAEHLHLPFGREPIEPAVAVGGMADIADDGRE